MHLLHHISLWEMQSCALPEREKPVCNFLPVFRHSCLRVACPMHAL